MRKAPACAVASAALLLAACSLLNTVSDAPEQRDAASATADAATDAATHTSPPPMPSEDAGTTVDACPLDPAKLEPGLCGCNEPDADADHDDILNCDDPDWPQAIRDCSELQAIRSGNLQGKYRLVLDIDCTGFDYGDGKGFLPLGEEGDPGPFTGTFDGNRHTITGVTIKRPDADMIGLFGATDGAVIERIGVVDAEIQGRHSVGALIGGATRTTVRESYTTGSVHGTVDVGGLIGSQYKAGTLSDSYTTAEVTGDADYGLLVGWVEAAVQRCYSSGVSAGSRASLGSLCGCNPEAKFTDSFFDCNVAGNCSALEGLSTNAMTSKATYTSAGWDFDDTWSQAGSGYPCLRWQAGCGP